MRYMGDIGSGMTARLMLGIKKDSRTCLTWFLMGPVIKVKREVQHAWAQVPVQLETKIGSTLRSVELFWLHFFPVYISTRVHLFQCPEQLSIEHTFIWNKNNDCQLGLTKILSITRPTHVQKSRRKNFYLRPPQKHSNHLASMCILYQPHYHK